MPAALETATAANLPLYAALGFVVTGSCKVATLDFWMMWREPA